MFEKVALMILALGAALFVLMGVTAAKADTQHQRLRAAASQCKAPGNLPVLSFDQNYVVCIKRDSVAWIR